MRIYYGWVIVAISMLVLMLSLGATMNAYGLFILPVSEELKLSRANVSTGIIFINLGMAVASPFVGRMLDLFSARRIMVVAIVLFGGSLAILGITTNVMVSGAILALPLSLGLVGLGTLTSLTLVARWFTAHRGRALAFTSIGMSLGGVLIAPLVGLLIEAIGWRQSLIFLGCTLTLLFLLLLPFIRDNPGPNDTEPAASVKTAKTSSADDHQVSAKPIETLHLLKMPQFWTIAMSAAMAFGALQAIGVAFVPLAQESGISTPRAASLLSVIGAMSIVGNVLFAWVGDRLNRIVLLAGLFSLVAPTSAVLLYATTFPLFLACGALFGLVGGAITPAFLALVADRFGPASFGTANGSAVFIISIVSAVCIRFGGEVYDSTGSYDVMFLTFIAIGLSSAVLMYLTRAFVRVDNVVSQV